MALKSPLGDYISLDGSTGKIYLGDIKTIEASVSGNFGRIMAWADEFRTLGVPFSSFTSIAASITARVCILAISG